MPSRLLPIAALTVTMLAVASAPALAVVHGGPIGAPMAVLGIDFPSVRAIVSDVVKFFFSTLLDALVPDWLRDATVTVIKRLVTVPNPTDERAWPTLARLSEGMRWIALPLVSLATVAAWVQQWTREMTGRPGSLGEVLPRTALAVLLLVSYPTIVSNAVALVNSITNAMLSLPAVQLGLERTVGIVFAGTLLSGSGVLLALLGIAAVVLAVGLFMLSVGLLVVFAIAFVSAPFAIACSVLEETRGIWTTWRYTLLTAALVPIGWCLLFATAGAFMVDMTTWSGGVAGTIGSRFVGVFAALIILWLALRWPLMLWSTIRLHIGGAMLSVGRSGPSSHAAEASGRTARAALQRTGMRTANGMSGALGTARMTAATSARMALGDGARLLARLPGAGAVAAVGAGAAGAAAAGLAPVARRAASAIRPVLGGATQARERGQAAGAGAKRAYARGATSRQAAGAGFAAAAGHAPPPRQKAPARTADRGTSGPAPATTRPRAATSTAGGIWPRGGVASVAGAAPSPPARAQARSVPGRASARAMSSTHPVASPAPRVAAPSGPPRAPARTGAAAAVPHPPALATRDQASSRPAPAPTPPTSPSPRRSDGASGPGRARRKER